MLKEYAHVYPRPDFGFQVNRGIPFSTIMKEVREREGIGLRELARMLGCSHVHLIKIEQGESVPSPQRLSELQKVLGIEPFFLVSIEDLDHLFGSVNLIRADGLKKDEPSVSFLYGLLLSALRRGGLEPTIASPTSECREQGVIGSLRLGSSQNYEILIREIN